ncbi:MAG: hypothetical protein EXR71_07210 [Myxococcales bacterium]|nr:hypothetical protein [Myxococcales bacterium]
MPSFIPQRSWWAVVAVALAAGCMQYRTYPLFSLEPPGKERPLELSGVALLGDGRVVAVAEGEADALYVPDPDRALREGAILDLLPLRDGRDACAEATAERCAVRNFRAEVRLKRQPVVWVERERRVGPPFDVEDLAAFGPERVLGVTKYSTVGRRTAFRRELIARSRRQTERLFVLERRDGIWYEQDLPEVTRLRDSLSDWGRANCNDDLLVEGLAWDETSGNVYVGLSRCSGPALRVLRYPLAQARLGHVATLESYADLGEGAVLGPAEGLTGLSARDGEVWAVSAWDSYGYDTEAAFGGRLWKVVDGSLRPVAARDEFRDRPSALAVLPRRNGPHDDLAALVLFDNDAEAGSPWRPNATVLTLNTPAPTEGRWVQLLSVEPVGDAVELGLNGFDLRWFSRDHRLSQVAFSVAEGDGGAVGAWSRALGGRWQMEVGGSLGMWARALLPRSDLGRNRQAVAVTDYRAVPGLRFTRYRVRLTVVPRDRERENPSVAELMESTRAAYTVQVPLPVAAEAGAGVILQGFSIDTAARAQEGLCMAGIDLTTSLTDPSTVQVRSLLIGGLCNDFDNRGPTLRHGRTTRPDGGVSVVLDIAVVEGATSASASASQWDRALPAPRRDPGEDRETAALRGTSDRESRAGLHCAMATAAAVTPEARNPAAPPPEWLSLAGTAEGQLAAVAGSLRGFAFAWDPVGFDPGLSRPNLTDAEALGRNNYVFRYLARAFVRPDGTFFEAGMSHGIHKSGLTGDNARPSALYARVDLTTFLSLAGPTPTWDLVAPVGVDDPNLLPEDAFTRWATPFPLLAEPTCTSAF